MWMMQAEAKLDTHMELMREQQENLKNNQNNQNQKPEHDEKLKAVHRQIKVCENDTRITPLNDTLKYNVPMPYKSTNRKFKCKFV